MDPITALRIIFGIASGVASYKSYKKAKKLEKEANQILLQKYGTGGGIPVAYGTRRVAGTVVYANTINNRELFVVYALSIGEIENISNIQIGNRSVADRSVFDHYIQRNSNYYGSTQQEIDNILSNQDPPNKPRMVFNCHLGGADQVADPMLVGCIPEWTSAHRLRGIAYIAANFDYDSGGGMFTGFPEITCDVQGKKLYDPRKDSTVTNGSGSHRIDNPSTYEFTDNSALVLLDYLTNSEYGKSLPTSAIDMQSFMNSADKNTTQQTINYSATIERLSTSDDTLRFEKNTTNKNIMNALKVGNTITVKIGETTYASGTVLGKVFNSRFDEQEKDYRDTNPNYVVDYDNLYIIQLSSGAVTTDIEFNPTPTTISITTTQDRFPFNGVIDTELSLFENTKKILGNMRGIFNYINGIYSLKIEDSESVALSIDDDDILESGITVSIENKEEKYNIVEVEFANAQTNYELDTIAFKHTSETQGEDYTYDDGGEELKLSYEMPYITNVNIAYQNAQAVLKRSRNNKSISFTGTHKLLFVKVGEVISVTNSQLGMSSEQYRITKMTINHDLTVNVEAIIYQSDIYGYVTPPTENIDIPDDLVDSFKVDTPTNVNFIDKDPSTGIQPYLEWDNPTTYPAYEFRVVVKDSNSNVKYDGRTKNTFFNLTGIEVDTGYTAEVRSLNTNYVESPPATYNFNNSVPPVQNGDLGDSSVTDAKVADISADKIDTGVLNLGTESGMAVRQAKTGYTDTTTGFWLGNDSGTPKFNIGTSSSYFKFDGSSVDIAGDLTATNLTIDANATINGTLDASVIRLDGQDLSTLIGFGATSPNASGDYFNFTGKVDFSDDVVFDDSVTFYSGVGFADGWNGQGIFDIDQGALEFGSYTPTSTTNRLYNVGGTLHWNGSQVGVGAVNSVTNMVDNRVITASGSNSINGEANLTFDGTTLTVTGDQVITGNLTVQGTTTTIDTTNLDVKDKNITLNYGTGDTSANANGAGITIQDAISQGNDATILWDTTDDTFDFNSGLQINKTAIGGKLLHLNNQHDNGTRNDLLIENTNDRDAGMTIKTSGGAYEMWLDSNGDDSLIFSAGQNTSDITMELYQDKSVDIGGDVLIKNADLNVQGNIESDTLTVQSSTNEGIDFLLTDNVGDQGFNGIYIDYNVSGTDTLTADRTHRALYIDTDSSASGGNTSQEHRVYSIFTDTRTSATGDSDIVGGMINTVYAQQSSGTTSVLRGINTTVQEYSSGTARTTNSYVYQGTLNIEATGTDTGARYYYVSNNKVLVSSDHTADINQIYGSYNEVEIDQPSSAYSIADVFGVMSRIDIDYTSNVDLDDAYLFYGNYQGDLSTIQSPFGVYIATNVDNYFRGKLGLNTASPSRNLHIEQDSTTNGAAYIYSNIAHTGTGDQSLLAIRQDLSTASGTTLNIRNDGTGILLNVQQGGNTAFVINNDRSVSGDAIKDEDDMSSNSATHLATQQSIKAYVDSQVSGVDTLAEILAIGNTTGGTDIAVSTGDDITFADSSKAIFGAGSDLQIFHNGVASVIQDNGTGNLFIQGSSAVNITNVGSSETYATFNENGAVVLYYDNSSKLTTTSGGVTVSGELDTTGNIAINKDVAKLTINNNTANTQASIDIKNTSLYARYILDNDDLFRIYNQTSGFDTFAVKSNGDLYMGSTKWLDLSRNLTNIGTISAGAITSSGDITVNTENAELQLIDTSSGNTTSILSNNFDTTIQADGRIFFRAGGSTDNIIQISSGGDVAFYEDTGTNTKFFWDASTQRLGIGNDAPSNTLDVTGGISLSGNIVVPTGKGLKSSGEFLNLESSRYLRYKKTGDSHNMLSIDGTADTITFSTTGSSDVVIDNSGRLGIGTTSPSQALGVEGKIFLSGDAQHVYFGGNNTFIGERSNSTHLELRGGGSTTAQTMYLDNSGRLGLGQVSPNNSIHIASSTPAIQLTDTDTNADARISASSGAGSLFIDADLNDESDFTVMSFRVDGSELGRFDSGGYFHLSDEIRFAEDSANGTNYVGLKAPASLGVDTTYTLPSTYPANSGSVLISTTAGELSWSANTVSTFSNGADNRIITATGASGINGETNLTYDGTTLAIVNTTPVVEIGNTTTPSATIRFKTANAGTPTIYFNDGTDQAYIRYGHGSLNGEKLTVSSATTEFTGTINIINANSRLTFSGYRALEGDTSGSILTVGEGYTTSLLRSNLNMLTGKSIQMNGTTVIDASRNLTNIGTISSGDITADSLDTDTVTTNDVIYQSSSTNVATKGMRTATTTATTETAVVSMSTGFTSVKFLVQITNTTNAAYHVTEITLLNDGTNQYISEYGTILTGSALATFDADKTATNLRLLATPTTTDTLEFKIMYNAIYS